MYWFVTENTLNKKGCCQINPSLIGLKHNEEQASLKRDKEKLKIA